jgi:UDP-glucose 4-epimerase
MKILIIGSNGFIGGSVGRYLANAGHEVLGVGRHSSPSWNADFVRCESLESLTAIIESFEPLSILHATGSASVDTSFESPLADLEDSVLTLARTLEACRVSRLRPLLVFPSSAAVYGNPPILPVSESAPINPISPYGYHMAARELIAREYAACFGLRVIAARLFSVFGPAQKRLFVWEMFERFIGLESMVWLRGTGNESRDYLHVDDVASALLGLMELGTNLGPPNNYLVVNVASGTEIKMIAVAEKARESMASRKQIRHADTERSGHPLHWRADISLLRSLVPGWTPQPFEERLAQCIADWKEANESALQPTQTGLAD